MRSVSLQTPDRFQTLAELLARPEPAAAQRASAEPAEHSDENSAVCARAARFFLAAVSEALESSVHRLLEDIAAEVLARELELNPPALQRIVDRALQRYASEKPVSIRLHPEDAARLSCAECPVISDAALRRGDAVLDVRDGAIDVSLGVRLADVLRGLA